MASTPVVSVDDVVRRYLVGDLRAEFTDDQIDTQIQDAVDYAATHWGSSIESRISGGRLTANLYKRTIANAVLRVLTNPEGYKNESEGGYSYGLDGTVSSGFLWFTDQEIATLSGADETVSPGTMRIGRGW